MSSGHLNLAFRKEVKTGKNRDDQHLDISSHDLEWYHLESGSRYKRKEFQTQSWDMPTFRGLGYEKKVSKNMEKEWLLRQGKACK